MKSFMIFSALFAGLFIGNIPLNLFELDPKLIIMITYLSLSIISVYITVRLSRLESDEDKGLYIFPFIFCGLLAFAAVIVSGIFTHGYLVQFLD